MARRHASRRRLALRGWRPQASWALGLHGSRAHLAHVQWLDNLQIASGALRSAAEVPVLLSRNGQQFAAIASHTFGYRAPPVVSRLSPRAGAAMAHTAVVVHGANLRHGSEYRCTFGPTLVPATYNGSAHPPRHARPEPTVHCEAPPLPAVRSTHVVVEATVSLNGIEPSRGLPGALGAFEYINSSAAELVPALGPSAGGSVVLVRGVGLSRGHDRECMFGAARVAATVHARRRRRRRAACASPHALNAGGVGAVGDGTVPVRVSLNGQDFNFVEPLNFTFYTPPAISALSPVAGPAGGGTVVTLVGAGFGGASPLLQCRFGKQVVMGSASDDSSIVCPSPTAMLAAAAMDDDGSGCTLEGSAAAHGRRRHRAHTCRTLPRRGLGALCSDRAQVIGQPSAHQPSARQPSTRQR